MRINILNNSVRDWVDVIPDATDKEELQAERAFVNSIARNTEDWDCFPAEQGLRIKLDGINISCLLNLLVRKNIPINIRYGD